MALLSSSGSTVLLAAEEAAAAAAAAAPAEAAPARLVLRLRPRRRITFSADTVDNEHLRRKKSKRCCIFQKPREFGESSTESSASESATDSDASASADTAARAARRRTRRACDDCQPAGSGPNPGQGWARRKARIPDYQRYHA
ncbi:phosphatase inhibitor-domain-containing protein [Pelagophyceae sp. CCMP2097]|nr:phosphatase inhibitor-domain-containing protein [Pelagophyceae sp. CCMP2097]